MRIFINVHFLKVIPLLVLMTLCLTGCPCVFPSSLLISENIALENIDKESVVHKLKLCEGEVCDEAHIDPGDRMAASDIIIQNDARTRRVTIQTGRGGWCSSDEDDNDVVWYRSGAPYKRLKLVCDTIDRTQYHAYLYDAFGDVKKFDILLTDGEWKLNLGENIPMSDFSTSDIAIKGMLPEFFALEKFQIVAYRSKHLNQSVVGSRVYIYPKCLMCAEGSGIEKYRRDRYSVYLDASTGVDKVVWYYDGKIFQTLDLMYQKKKDELLHVEAILNRQTPIKVEKTETGVKWVINL